MKQKACLDGDPRFTTTVFEGNPVKLALQRRRTNLSGAGTCVLNPFLVFHSTTLHIYVGFHGMTAVLCTQLMCQTAVIKVHTCAV